MCCIRHANQIGPHEHHSAGEFNLETESCLPTCWHYIEQLPNNFLLTFPIRAVIFSSLLLLQAKHMGQKDKYCF